MQIIKAENYQEMSKIASNIVINKIQSIHHPVLGLATGSTPIGLYKKLISEHRDGTISFKNTVTFNLDEYIGLPAEHANSYRQYMNNQLFQHIDIPSNQTNIPNGMAVDFHEECRRYDALIEEAGEIDLQILGLGNNGHIGFNEPGTPFNQSTHIVELAPSTIEANARFFDSLDEVPTQAITMGIETIMRSKEILLLVAGEEKKDAYRQLLKGKVTEDFPASVLHNHKNCTVIVDKTILT
ncbi:glucosamine-6-phosphate deaminase [Gracilibacillus massiliensis]|uniref:glucosamine-6-phosphate deaminase n=1 Tax=Gracilibacillus massiliensis TaxID=1564956 RepID=UPI00071D90A7|nr:glucosamine-6-phosphate deaminase [Gracilibacillus massiliensis]